MLKRMALKMLSREYGKDGEGRSITAPTGWKILPQGEYVPQVHREFLQMPGRKGAWCEPRRGYSTMTAIHAQVWGNVQAYAVREDEANAPSSFNPSI
jgi:hypothetical protein